MYHTPTITALKLLADYPRVAALSPTVHISDSGSFVYYNLLQNVGTLGRSLIPSADQ